MRLSARSFPHPVLGNRDDVPGAAFQATLEMSADRQYVYLAVDVACSCSTINSLLLKRDAVFVAHVECSNTLFRQAYEFNGVAHRISIPADNLSDTVEVNIFVRAINSIDGYQVPEAHSDYRDAVFGIRKGDILAVAEGQVFHLESLFDSLRRIGSIMQISESSKEGDVPMEPDYDDDKIVVYLSKADFADYKLLRNNEGLAGPLSTAIVLPVLLEALHIVESEDSGGMDDNRRWVRVLTRRIEALGLVGESSRLVKAQMLLEMPIKRALSSSRMLAEATS